jgi:uncharacterized protein (DUF362 family)/NAD-dependent dihydropyrimidine dehydrogenase PreA subunit
MTRVNQESTVAVRECPSYADAEQAVAGVLADIGQLEVFRGKRALLKVNLMRATPPEQARTTHPELLRAMIRVVKEHGGTPLVAESAGIIGFTDESFEASGLGAVIQEENAELVNLDAQEMRRVEIDGKELRLAYLPAILWECDVLVTLPKLKTHTLTTFTGALKNQVGLLPGGSKCAIHRTASTPARLAEAIADINVAVPFHLGMMDGVVGLEGGGSVKGKAVACGIVAASTDLVALDAVCCALVGIAPEQVPTTVAADARGIGRGKLEEIRVIGRQPTDPVASFARPGPEPKRNPLVAKAVYRMRQQALWPVAVHAECQQCGTCAEICPVDAITLDPWPTVARSCIYCFACRERCPTGAMKLSCKWYLRAAFRGRAKELPLRHML